MDLLWGWGKRDDGGNWVYGKLGVSFLRLEQYGLGGCYRVQSSVKARESG